MNNLTKLSQILTNFVSTLSPEQRLLFKDLCNEWAHAHYEFGEVFKMQYIDLIPPKIQQPNKDGYYGVAIDNGTRIDPRSVMPTFTPQTKKKGDPLQELLSSMSDDKKKEIQEKLQKIVNKGETK